MIRKIDINDLEQLNHLTKYFDIIINNEDLNKKDNYYFGYFVKNKLVAFINYTVYYERAEINYIFVIEEYRRKKIADKLLKFVIKNNYYLDNITLEVRISNNAAIKLYEKNNFKKCTIRKNYYKNEDAILMIKNFGDDE